MAQVINKLSALTVARMATPGYYADGGGLYLQVSPSGSKSWIFRYSAAGRRREMGLGAARDVSLSEARTLAQACRKTVGDGRDPLDEAHSEKLARRLEHARLMTFRDCAEAYIKAHRASWRNAKHAKQWESTLENYAFPIIGQLPVAEVDTALVVRVLGPIWEERTETAARLRGRIESILDWATVSKFRVGDNPARWRGHLDHLLADPNRVAPVVHRPALPWMEAPMFMKRLEGSAGIAARALEFCILTAARSVEVRGARWQEIDFDQAIWTVPPERMKAGREHRVPLPVRVIELVRAQHRTSEFIFPGRGGNMISDMTLTAVLRRMGRGDITVHGFRSTFRDWCAEYPSNAFSREVCEHALAHRLPDKVEAAYRRGELIDKRRLLMMAWATFLYPPT